jgi:glyoxylase-like metal-dependent hydrolase (beta-lactamase superfamily II)
MTWRGKLGSAALALALVAGGAYYWLLYESHVPAGCSFALDLAQIRALAGAGPGPREIRVERVARRQFPGAVAVAGDSWAGVDFFFYSYQLVYADRTAVIDTTFSAEQAAEMGAVDFDAAAFGRVGAALSAASAIAITHEHGDHLGGLAAHPDLKALLGVAALTREQLSDPSYAEPARLPEDALAGYRPLEYDRYHALAPGVVLIKAPGHTPGSQMVYVRREDGAELVFLGDVAWQMGAVDKVRGRPRLATLLLGEDRDQDICELDALHRLKESEPKIALIPGHDGTVIAELIRRGLLIEGFSLAAAH